METQDNTATPDNNQMVVTDQTRPSVSQPSGSNSTLPSTTMNESLSNTTPIMPSDQNGGVFIFNQPNDANQMPQLPTVPMMPFIPQVESVNAPQETNGRAMTTDEIALYDRQIRLWGMQAQQKIQAANVLLISMKALANEIAKNLVLAGIGSLTIVDDQIVTEADLGAQFFLAQENLGQNRAEAAAAQAQKLNPRVKVFPDTDSIMTKGPSYFANFDIVVATDLAPTVLTFINTATRLHNRQFYAAGVHGLYGYIFCDLIEHDYVLKRDKGNMTTTVGPESRWRSVVEVKTQREGNKTVEMVSKRAFYSTWELASDTSALPEEYLKSKRRLKAVTPALSCLRALWQFYTTYSREPGHNKEDLQFFTRLATNNHQLLSLPPETLRSEFLRSFLQNIGSEIAPVTAILGGQLAQDVINVLGQNQQPIQNMVILDGNKMEANMYPLHPDGNLGRSQLDFGNVLPQMDLPPVDLSQMMPMDPSAMTPVMMDPTAMDPSVMGAATAMDPSAAAAVMPQNGQ
ncbi:hypothetical protein F5Y16DRAFT_16239 [Xylariaceae sp. FL0255]|nr:hypothetical protein F5Y16DRAFT_16239 [Xylariaceae sp. FL0255]